MLQKNMQLRASMDEVLSQPQVKGRIAALVKSNPELYKDEDLSFILLSSRASPVKIGHSINDEGTFTFVNREVSSPIKS